MFLPDPWIPEDPYSTARSQLTLTSFGHGTIVATNNDAHIVPVVFPCDVTVYSLSFYAANTSGNYDLGLYDASLNLLVSKGSTAMAVGVQTLTVPEMRFMGGTLVYASAGFSNTLAQVLRPLYTTTAMEFLGWGYQASAVPLPNPFVPISTAAYQQLVLFAFGVR